MTKCLYYGKGVRRNIKRTIYVFQNTILLLSRMYYYSNLSSREINILVHNTGVLYYSFSLSACSVEESDISIGFASKIALDSGVEINFVFLIPMCLKGAIFLTGTRISAPILPIVAS